MTKSNKIVLLDIDFTFFDTAHYKKTNLSEFVLYSEVIDTLNKLEKIAILGIFSEGVLEFQKEKLTRTKVSHYFHPEHIHIVERKFDVIKNVLDKYKNEQLFLVDDRLTVLHTAKLYKPNVTTFWVKRGVYAMNQEPIDGFEPDATVPDLRSIVELVAQWM